MEFKTLVSAIAFFLFTVAAVSALRCYECNGTNDGPCYDPEGENVTNVSCEEKYGQGEYYCFKLIYTLNGNEVLSRGCRTKTTWDAFCNLTSTAEDVECLSCEEDLCNSSNKIGAVSFTVLALCLLLAKLF